MLAKQAKSELALQISHNKCKNSNNTHLGDEKRPRFNTIAKQKAIMLNIWNSVSVVLP